jgi:predicted dehydrogenase
MKPVVWGVLGGARIALTKVIPGMRKSAWCEIRAIASRSEAAARKAADAAGIAKVFASYDALLADPEIEAVYIPLPNHLHVLWTLKAAALGKHVLCEKPICLSVKEAEQLEAVPPGILVMEAFMVRFHPQWQHALELVKKGEIGELRAVQVAFAYRNLDPANIRNIADLGGGALYDIGCYAIVAGRTFFGKEPRRAIALVDRDPAFRTDRLASALLDFGQGQQLAFTVSTQSTPYQRIQLFGTEQRIEIPIPFNAPQGETTQLWLDNGTSLTGAGVRTVTLPESDQYMLQGEVFSRAVRGELKLPYGIEDAIRNMRVIDALFRSEKSSRWETL